MLEQALAYAALGYSVIPCRPGTKRPAIETWMEYQVRHATEDEIRQWWGEWPDANVAIVTGAISNLTVIDVDGDVGLASMRTIIDQISLTQVIKTPHGWHLYYEYNPLTHTGVGFLPGIDLRADGGYVIAPPSVVDGQPYWVRSDRLIVPLTTLPEEFTAHHRNGNTPVVGQPIWISDALDNGTSEGKRNALAARLAGYLHSKDMPPDLITRLLTPFAEKCIPPLERKELETIVKSITRYPPYTFSQLASGLYSWPIPPLPVTSYSPPLPSPTGVHIRGEGKNDIPDTNRYTNVTENVTDRYDVTTVTESVTNPVMGLIRHWVSGTEGKWWTTDELDRDIGIQTPEAKGARRVALHRLRAEGLIENHQRANKMFRTKDPNVASMDFQHAPRDPGMDFRWPLQVEQLTALFPGNLAVIAGTQDAGKTALMLSLIDLNQDRFPMYYFCSEMSDTDLRYRLEMFDRPIESWTFKAFYRVSDFADVIEPDGVNLIDFIELNEDANMVNKYLTDIRNRLRQGIAIIGLQKKENLRKGDNYKYGKGAEGTAEKPRLYVSLDKTLQGGVAKIVKGKNWVNRRRNPNGLQMAYQIVDGCHFIPMGEWEHAD